MVTLAEKNENVMVCFARGEKSTTPAASIPIYKLQLIGLKAC